jgi:hypothetical protein
MAKVTVINSEGVEVKERPIILSEEMILSFLSGRKDHLRTVVDPQPTKVSKEHERRWYANVIPPGGCIPNKWSWWEGPWHGQSLYHEDKCPWGKQGDRIWVKEPFCDNGGGIIEYKATSISRAGSWSSSSKMSRKNSRLVLEIEDIWVEMLKDISKESAIREGVLPEHSWPSSLEEILSSHVLLEHYGEGAKNYFPDYWDKNNPNNPWESDPWVWAMKVKVIK